MNQINVDLDRRLGNINRYILGSFAEHLGRCIYRGIYEPESAVSDEDGLRTDVLNAMCQLRIPVLRYPGGNFFEPHSVTALVFCSLIRANPKKSRRDSAINTDHQ